MGETLIVRVLLQMAAVLHLGVRPGEQSASWNQASLAILARHPDKGHTLATLHGSLYCFLAILQDSRALSQPPLTAQRLGSGQNCILELLGNLSLLLSVSGLSFPSHLRISPAGPPKHITGIGFCSLHTSTKPRRDCICFFLLGIWFFSLAFHTSLPPDHGWL